MHVPIPCTIVHIVPHLSLFTTYRVSNVSTNWNTNNFTEMNKEIPIPRTTIKGFFLLAPPPPPLSLAPLIIHLSSVATLPPIKLLLVEIFVQNDEWSKSDYSDYFLINIPSQHTHLDQKEHLYVLFYLLHQYSVVAWKGCFCRQKHAPNFG